MLRSSILAAALLAAGSSAIAQPRGAGAQIQQIPPPRTPPPSIPDIRIERGQPPTSPGPPGALITVSMLHVTGATRFTEAELIAVTGFRPGSEMDLAELRTMAARISDFYSRHGYPLAQAYLPAQAVEGGAVTIAVIEGRYGKVNLDNKSRVSDGLARSLLAGLDPGDLVATAPLERRLLLLSDLPGVAVNATLSPGEAVGTSDLLVDLERGRRVTGSLEADNAGNYYTGAWRGGATVNLNEIIGQGDVASLRVLTAGEGLVYIRGSYQVQIQALTVGVGYAHFNYRLGHEFEPLDARGTEGIANLYASYPLIRSRNTNLYALGDLEYRTFKDEVRSIPTEVDRSARVASFGLAGDHRDGFLGGGWTTYSATGTFGDLDIETPAARAIDALTARTNGSYGKFFFEAARLQHVAGRLSLYGEARGQLATKNLDPSEKMELGGAYGVRAYPEGEAYGDEGYILTAEARFRLASFTGRMGGDLQAVAFVDHGHVTINKDPWAPGLNHRSLGAAGVGLTWEGSRGLVLKAAYAFKLGDGHALAAPDHSGRLWVQLLKYF